MSDAAGIYEDLSIDECLELLRTHQFGRIAVVIDGGPVVFPINYAIDGAVVFRTDGAQS
jgi:nitroimidazol reductase NimA-like FMN-containing flavoprotein (pyridoxamine 5'-phosphate oxidase superfamily)